MFPLITLVRLPKGSDSVREHVVNKAFHDNPFIYSLRTKVRQYLGNHPLEILGQLVPQELRD